MAEPDYLADDLTLSLAKDVEPFHKSDQWTAVLSATLVSIPYGQSTSVTLTVTAPKSDTVGEMCIVIVTATSAENTAISGSDSCTTWVLYIVERAEEEIRRAEERVRNVVLDVLGLLLAPLRLLQLPLLPLISPFPL